MEWIIPKDEIESELLLLEQSSDNKLVLYDRAIGYCQKILEEYRIAVVSHGFVDDAAEIYFFKNEKPFLFGQLLKYTRQLSFELDFPSLGRNEDVIMAKMREINSFLSAHRDFLFYMELQHHHLDPQYFLRKNRKNNAFPRQLGFSFDPGFSTSHDGLLAHILGYQGFYRYLQNLLAQDLSPGYDPRSFSPKIEWTGSKVALTELGFALYYSGAIGHGNTGLKTIMKFLEQVSGLDLGDYHHTSIRLRNRSNPTKFLDRLQDSLKKWITDLDA